MGMDREKGRERVNLGVEANLLAHDVLELGLADGASGVAEGPIVRDEAKVRPERESDGKGWYKELVSLILW
jgi:hypothetical protein